MKKSAAIAIVLCMTWIASAAPVWALMPFNPQEAIEQGDHRALANYYRSLAEEQRRVADMHQTMKTNYRNTHVHYKGIENTLAGHCGALQRKALQMAEYYDRLAAQEEKLVEQK